MKNTLRVLWVLVLVVLVSSFYCQAQRTPYKNSKKMWQTAFAIPHKVKPQFEQEDIVILKQETNYTINEQTQVTGTATNDSRYRGSSIKKHIIAQILTPKGVEQFKTITLPQPINHYTDDYEGLASRQNSFNQLKHQDTEVQYFMARALLPNGTQKRIVVEDAVKTEKMGKLGEIHKTIEYQFELKNLQVGSVVEIEYEIFVPTPLGFPIVPAFNNEMAGFFTAPSFYYWGNFFFHEAYPIQQSKTTFSCFNELRMEWQFQNGATPTDSLHQKSQNTYIWEMQDLEAATFQPNQHAYKHLPHVSFYYHNLLYGNWTDTKITAFKPYTWEFICSDVLRFKGDNAVLTSQFSLKERLLTKLFEQHQNAQNSPIQILKSMQLDLLQNYTYQDNRKYFFDRDLALYETGNDLRKKEIHEINRFSIYDGLLRRLGQNYYLVFAPDKRTATVNQNQPIVPINPIMFYAVQFGETLVYLMPKHNNLGFYLDELPFFLEAQKALFVAQQARTKFDENNILFLDLPKSSNADNYRWVQAKAQINLNQKNAKIEAEITLSGQFSTILRPFYAQKISQKWADEQYYTKFYEWKIPTEIKENLPLSNEDSFPFKAQKKVKFEANKHIEALENNIFSINLSGCLQHVPSQVPQNQNSPFYFDFQMQDRYSYLLELDTPVELLNQSVQAINYVQNAVFGAYSVQVQQISPTQILLESKLNITQEKAEIPDLPTLKNIYQHMEQMHNETIIQVKKL